jgi:nucleotide-binding universal stress UspA family protein
MTPAPASATKPTIVVGVDGSAASEAAIRWAASEAGLRGFGITLVHVVTPAVVSWPLGPMHANITEWQRDRAGEIVDAARRILDKESALRSGHVDTVILNGSVVPTPTDAAGQTQMVSQMIVVGSRGTRPVPPTYARVGQCRAPSPCALSRRGGS